MKVKLKVKGTGKAVLVSLKSQMTEQTQRDAAGNTAMSGRLKIMPRFLIRNPKMSPRGNKHFTEENIHSDAQDGVQVDLDTVLQNLPLILDVPHSGSSEERTAKEQCSIHMLMFWTKIIPQPPENLEHNLEEHLRTVQEDVVRQLERLKPLLQPHGLMGYLEDCCHRRMLHHLQSLLQRVSSCRSCFELMYWARHVYLRNEEFSHPDCQKIDGWVEWETKAKDKLIPNVQKELQGHLEKILQDHKVQKPCDSEEAYVGLHVDVIQCTFTMPEKAKLIDQELSDEVLQVCSQELLTFVKGYNMWQVEFLKKKPETIDFLKTLRTCREIRTHIQKEDMEETVELLNEMETFTKDLLTQVVADDVEKNLQRYFKSGRETFPFAALEKHFPRLDFVVDEHEAVMGDIYKAVAHVYFKHLIGTSMRKLRKTWSPDIGTTVHEDAVELHHIISDRAKDVQQCNKLLLSIEEVLTCSDMEGMKLTMAVIQNCHKQSEDLQLLPNLLLWRGFSRRAVRTVMEALPAPPPKPRSRFWPFQSCWGRRC